jgi:hypothetical protein
MKSRLASLALCVAGLMAVFGATPAVLAQGILLDNPDWKESEVPPPPAFDVNKLVTFEVSGTTALVFGVDPASISLSRSDSILRYVMVATSRTGTRNIMYEGLRCATGEVKTYARFTPDGRWNQVANPEWRSVFGAMPSPHALRFARAGACDGVAPRLSVNEIVDRLKNSNRYLDQ